MKNKKNTKISHWINAIVLTLVPFLGTFFGVGEYTYTKTNGDKNTVSVVQILDK